MKPESIVRAMRSGAPVCRSRWSARRGTGRLVMCALGIALLAAGSGVAQDDESLSVINVVIEDSTFHVTGGALTVNDEVVIVLHNLDAFKHGFVWSDLKGVKVRVETGEVAVYGKGVGGLYIEPAGEVRISFTPARSGRLKFHCDIHADMSGEVAYMTIDPI